MATLEQQLDWIGLTVSPYRLAQMRWLERHGQRFLVDYGIQNAHAKVRETRQKNKTKNTALALELIAGQKRGKSA